MPTGEQTEPDALRGDALELEGLGAPPPRGAPDLHVRWPDLPHDGDVGVAATPRDPLGEWTREQAGRARVDGGLVHPYYRSPSKDAEVDRAAVEDVRAAAQRLPVPPDDLRAGRDTFLSIWEFELEISITPPLPIVEVEFDEVLGLKDLRVPLDRRIWKRVRLVAVM